MLVTEMIEAGASGFVMKNPGKEELLHVIMQTYMNDGSYCSRTNKKLSDFWGKKNARMKMAQFTMREMEVMELICDGLTHDEIAKKLCVSKKTVDTCSHKILEKINEKKSIGKLKYALRYGLYTLKNDDTATSW